MLSKRSHYTKKSILYDSIPIKFKTMAKPNCDVRVKIVLAWLEEGSNWKMASKGHVLRLILNASSLSVITVKIHEDIYSGFASI